MTSWLRDHFEPLLRQYGIDLFVNGHIHYYQRTCPVWSPLNDECLNRGNRAYGTVHVTVGTGGARNSGSAVGSPDSPITNQTLYEYGYTTLQLVDRNHARLQFVNTRTGETQDDWWIESDHEWHLTAI